MYDENQIISFVQQHVACLGKRPISLMHADFQSDNMVISPQNDLYIIDFQECGMVDPYYALTGIMVTAEISPSFSIGQLNSYFGCNVPEEFWEINAFYMAAESINAFSVAVKIGSNEVNYSNNLVKIMLDWYDNMDNIIPKWYRLFKERKA